MNILEIKNDLQNVLAKVNFPADKQEIIDHAEGQGAHENVLDFLDKLPEGKLQSIEDVMAKILF